MKRAFSILLILLLAATLSTGAFAGNENTSPDAPVSHQAVSVDSGTVSEPSGEGGGESPANPGNISAVQALYDEWEQNGYPDDIGGVYFDDELGELVVLLKNGTDARREELRALTGDPDLQFTDCAYSINELREVRDRLLLEMSGDASGIYGLGIGWTTRDGEVVGFGESGREFRVTVMVDEKMLDRYAQEFAARFGDMVHVEAGQMPVTDDYTDGREVYEIGAMGHTGGNAPSAGPLGLLLPALAALTLGALVILSLRRARAARTTAGTTVTARPLSRRDVEEAVRESAPSPLEEAYGKLMERIDKNEE